MSLLEVEGLVVEYIRRRRPPVQAVAGVDLSLEPGEILGLVGESGCGKSTLAKAVVGLVPAARGAVRLDGEPVRALGRGARPRAQTRLQMVFQDPYSSLNPRRKVGPQIADGLAIAGGVDRGARRSRAVELLERVGMPAAALDRYPHEFSGGQRQRIAIARALAPAPSVIVADEVVSALDASTQAQVANLLTSLARDLGVGLVFISHDLGVVRHLADTVAVMYLGRIVERAPARRLWSGPQHPYTEALIAAVPAAEHPGVLPEAPAGEVGDPAHPPTGCRFHPRCPYVFDRCPSDDPPLLPVAEHHGAACWLVPRRTPAPQGAGPRPPSPAGPR